MNARAALAIDRKAVGGQHPATALALNIHGTALSQQGRHNEAQAALDEALASSLAALTGLLEATGRCAEAAAWRLRIGSVKE